MRVLGCLCFSTSLPRSDKFGPKAMKFILLSYVVNRKGYQLLELENNFIFTSRDALFHKYAFPFQILSADSNHLFLDLFVIPYTDSLSDQVLVPVRNTIHHTPEKVVDSDPNSSLIQSIEVFTWLKGDYSAF